MGGKNEETVETLEEKCSFRLKKVIVWWLLSAQWSFISLMYNIIFFSFVPLEIQTSFIRGILKVEHAPMLNILKDSLLGWWFLASKTPGISPVGKDSFEECEGLVCIVLCSRDYKRWKFKFFNKHLDIKVQMHGNKIRSIWL